MKRLPILLIIAVLAGAAAFFFKSNPAAADAGTKAPAAESGSLGASSPTPPAVPGEQPAYVIGTATADGIGKFFHGREISQVMGHPGIGWLERNEREREEAPTKAIDALELAPDAVIADIGAGSGYYAFRLAPKVPDGRVIAVDIQPEMIEFLANRAEETGISNVTPHLGEIDDIKLPPASLDAVLMVDAYHEFSHPAEMLTSLFHALKPGGVIYLLEFRGEDDRVPIKPLHKMTEAQARLELETAGFRFVSNRRHLPWQHFMVFQRP